jgi:hypothetical protein
MRARHFFSHLLPQMLFLLGAHFAAGPAVAQNVALQWSGTQKVEQIIGDVDWQTGAPTMSQTYSKSYVLGNGLGYSFEHFNRSLGRNELIFLFGDTVAFGTYSFNRGFDCNAVSVGAASSVTTACTTPPTPPSDFVCPLGPPPFITIAPCEISAFNFHGQDPIAHSDSTDPNAPLDLQFFMQNKLPLFVTPTPLRTNSGSVRIDTGGDDIPNSGISVKNNIYIVYNTGADASCTNPCDPHANAFSVLVRFHQKRRTFETLRELSAVNAGGHFLFTTMHHVGGGVGGIGGPDDVLMFGTGDYRKSDIYLARIPAANFATGIGTQYFRGLDDQGRPRWTPPANIAQAVLDNQAQATPVIFDDAPSPSIGNISVAYVPALRLWLMTYDADGTNPPATRSVFFRYTSAPWGKWSDPQPIFNACSDGGFGKFIHYAAAKASDCVAADPAPSGPGGPMIGQDNGANDPETQRGGAFAPSMIEPFIKVQNGKLSIYYTLSTWNPYTVVKMQSDFAILQPQ